MVYSGRSKSPSLVIPLLGYLYLCNTMICRGISRRLRRRFSLPRIAMLLVTIIVFIVWRKKTSVSEGTVGVSLARRGGNHEYAYNEDDKKNDKKNIKRIQNKPVQEPVQVLKEKETDFLNENKKVPVLKRKNGKKRKTNALQGFAKLKDQLGFEIEGDDALTVRDVDKTEDEAEKNILKGIKHIMGQPGAAANGHNEAPDYIGHDDQMKFKVIEDKIKEKTKEDTLELGKIGRDLPDVRPNNCRHRSYPDNLPTASVVIVFYEEGLKTLLRSVHSIVKRSPPRLINEIILIDDCSTRERYTQELKVQLKHVDYPIVVKRTKQRFGWVLARIQGAEYATGEVLIFLDAHTEVTEGWLEPLLARIQDNPHNVVFPVIDHIDQRTLEYTTEPTLRVGVFDWSLEVTWQHAQTRGTDPTSPLKSPVIADSIFAMQREYFNQLDRYDAFYTTEDTADLDLSFKVWMCGGCIEQLPCSHVGHLHRYSVPFQLPGRGEINDKKRLVEVWFREYNHFFYTIYPDARRENPGDLINEEMLQKKMKCKSIYWYWETVYPLSIWPVKGERYGEIRHIGSDKCLDIALEEADHRIYGAAISIIACDDAGARQVWMLTAIGEMKNNFVCLESFDGEGVTASKCHRQRSNQEWMFDFSINRIYHTTSKHCLHAGEDGRVTLQKCLPSPAQSWKLSPRDTEEYRDAVR